MSDAIKCDDSVVYWCRKGEAGAPYMKWLIWGRGDAMIWKMPKYISRYVRIDVDPLKAI